MPYCPACRTEYEEGSKKCSDCGGDLAAGAMPETPSIAGASDEKWESLLRVRREDNAEIIRGLLESADIPCEVIDKMAAQMPLPVSTTLSRFEIWVPEARANEARNVLNEAREGTVPCPACGHMSAAEESACEYCGAALR